MAPERDSKKVMWIDGAHKPYTVSIECFFTLPQDSDPVLLSPPPEHYRHLISLQLSSGAWFVVFVQVILLNEDELDALREEMREMAIAAGVVGGDKVAAFISNESGTSGLIEISIEG